MIKRIFKKKPCFCNPQSNFYSSSVYNKFLCTETNLEQICPALTFSFLPSLVNIPSNVFCNRKIMPDIVTVPITIESASDNAFNGVDFKYVYQIEGSEEKIFTKTNFSLKNARCSASIDELKNVLPGLTSEGLVQIIDLKELIMFAKKLQSTKTAIPFSFYIKLKNEDIVRYFMNNAYFKFFNKEISPYLKKFENQPQNELASFFAFANALGCFTKENVVNTDNEKTESLICHKASNLLAKLLQSETLILGGFYYLFSHLPVDIIPNQDFYNFLSARSGKNNFVNAKILIKNSIKNRDFFMKVMLNFDKAKGFKRTLNSEGQPIELPWETALNLFYYAREYKGITKENRVMAKIYSKRGIKQKTFNEACDIFEEAELSCVPNHILGEHLKEFNDGTKSFTYDFLDKSDPKNAILGLYCNCCATIASEYYGRDITIASVLAPDVQNVVVRDKCGRIIAKGTLYVNEKKGYAVFNDFEVEYKYRADREYVWNDTEDVNATLNQLKRKEIFDTFMRAVRDFKLEYDEQHPEKPLKKVTVGAGFNKLKEICEENLPKSQTMLRVPKVYSFKDADDKQYLMLGKNINRKKKIQQVEDCKYEV